MVRHATSQESGYATRSTDKQPAGMSGDVSFDEYGARPKVRFPDEGKPSFTPHAGVDDVVTGHLFDTPKPRRQSIETDNAKTGHIIKPATYDGTNSWLDYKSHFEACAVVNGWTDDKKGLYLAVSLRGQAQSVLGDLPSDTGQHYQTLVRSLEERFSPPNQTDLYRVQLKERRQRASESIPELGQAIRRLTNLAYASAPGDVRETLAKDAFVDALVDLEMRIPLTHLRRPQNLNEAIRLAVELEDYNRAESSHREARGRLRVSAAEYSSAEGSQNSLETWMKSMEANMNTLTNEIQKLKLNRPVRKTFDKPGLGRPVRSKQTSACPSGSIGVGSSLDEAGMYIDISVQGVQAKFLVDTGATLTLLFSAMYEKIAENIGPKLQKVNQSILAANVSEVSVKGKADITLNIEGMVAHSTAVISEIQADGILGLDFLLSNACTVDMSQKVLHIKDKKIQLFVEGYIGCNRITATDILSIPPRSEIIAQGQVLKDGKHVPRKTFLVEPFVSDIPREGYITARTLVLPQETVPVRLFNVGEESRVIYPGTVTGQLKNFKPLDAKAEKEANKFLFEYTNLFAKCDKDLGRTGIVKHRIDTGDSHPIKISPRRVPAHLTDEVDQQLNDMLERGVIEPSNSPWSAPIVLAKKKDGTFRFCIDYRKLNSCTIKDAYPLPRIDESLDQLSGSSWFSTLDLCSGYWKVEMEPDDKQKTAFATRRGLFQFKVMPFGLCCAPATFERLIENVLAGLHCVTMKISHFYSGWNVIVDNLHKRSRYVNDSARLTHD
ncbi:uncharacterized protein LOC134261188 [Saccostrea cucullata]|uniref:uncharacterized protein LOC134261188 n=1 Tax=Saccostrea cuccullata TaxID=36930 RepID=UPI002ED20287